MRMLHEPLVHFLLGGAFLFVLFGQAADPRDATSGRIVMSEFRIAGLASTFERLWLRSPTEDELRGLIEDYLKEEILYREALALGLDRDDLVVRRRLRQKMEFLNEDLTATQEPSEEELRDYLAANAASFRVPARTSFEQLFLDPARSDRDVYARAASLLAAVRAGDGGALGDSTLLPANLDRATPREIDQTFGEGFSESIAARAQGEWSGPFSSSFGLHLVRVTARETERMPGLEEVRQAVARDWDADQRRSANERFYEALRSRYQVEIRLPRTSPPETPGS